MQVNVRYQDSFSRGELILRTLFGFIYILIPHLLILLFVMIASSIIGFIAFWAILFTGKFPRGMWDFQMGVLRWNLRLNARLNNIADGYPAFGLNVDDPNTSIELAYPESSSRGLVLLRVFFGFIYVYIPHGLCLLFLGLGAAIVRFLAFWIVLFTAKYPQGMFDFMVGVQRWGLRVSAYMMYLTDTYPPFSLENQGASNAPIDQNM
jgi:hypothetical protein